MSIIVHTTSPAQYLQYNHSDCHLQSMHNIIDAKTDLKKNPLQNLWYPIARQIHGRTLSQMLQCCCDHVNLSPVQYLISSSCTMWKIFHQNSYKQIQFLIHVYICWCICVAKHFCVNEFNKTQMVDRKHQSQLEHIWRQREWVLAPTHICTLHPPHDTCSTIIQTATYKVCTT